MTLSLLLAQVAAVILLSLPVLRGRDTIIYEQARRMAAAHVRIGAMVHEREPMRLASAGAAARSQLDFSTTRLEQQMTTVTLQVLFLFGLALSAGMLIAYRLSRMVMAAQSDLRMEVEHLRVVGDMSEQLAHDVRNPLATVCLNVDLLDDELAACACTCAAEAKGSIEVIRRSLARTNAALAEYVELAGLSRARLAPGDVNGLLDAEVESCRHLLEERRVTPVLALADALPPVLLDARRLGFAVRALLRHAVDAMHGGGTLTVSTEVRNGAAHVRISDTGGAIGEAERLGLFKLFTGRRPNSGGPGLGLARAIVQAHNGTLELERTGATGSTFLLVLALSGTAPRTSP